MTVAWNFSKRIVADVVTAERFYTALGFKTVISRLGGQEDDQVRQEQIYMSVTGDGTSHQLILCRFPAFPPPKPVYPGEAWLCINVADVEQTCRTAVQFGGTVVRAGQDRAEHGVRAAVIADVDGHYIEIVGPMSGARPRREFLNSTQDHAMTDFQMPKAFSPAEIQEREDYVRARPPRLPGLPSNERSQRQQDLLDEMSMVVVDGVRKPREDKPALEIMIRHAELYKAHLDVAQKYLSECELDIRDRELAILRIGWLSQAPFEWGAHVKIAKRNGVTSEEIERVIEGSYAVGWCKKDRAIIRSMEELHFASMISDETWADLQEHHNDKKLIELVILAGQYKTVAYYQNCLRLPLPESNKGLSAR